MKEQKHLLSYVRRAVEDYEMIEDGTWTWDGFENILRTIGGSPSNLSEDQRNHRMAVQCGDDS